MSASLTIPRPTTWEILQRSRNRAAIATLSSGLSSTVADLRHACVKSLIARQEPESRQAIILHWESFDENDLELIRSKSSHFIDTLNSQLGTGTLAEKRSALAAIAALDLSDSIDIVLDIAVDPKHALCIQATHCLLEMCQHWGGKARSGHDSPTKRGKMLEKLYEKLTGPQALINPKLVDAWLCLAHWDDSLQRGLIADPRHDVYRVLLKRLRESELPAVVQLLGGYLCRPATPASVINILAERPEPMLAVEIAKMLDNHTLMTALKRLRRLPPLQCLKLVEGALGPVNIEIEKRIWLMISASSDDLTQVLRGAVKLSKLGTREARQTAADMLRRCRQTELETLVPAIQAAASGIHEEVSCLGNIVEEVAEWLNSPSLALKKAAREFLQDFTIDNLLDQVRCWPMEMCRAMASIVVLMETDCAERLTRELQSPAPKRRLAALQVTQLLDCSHQVSQALMPLLDDPRMDVRVQTIDLLAALGHEALELMIPRLLEDASTDIQDAASRAVRRLKRHKRQPSL